MKFRWMDNDTANNNHNVTMPNMSQITSKQTMLVRPRESKKMTLIVKIKENPPHQTTSKFNKRIATQSNQIYQPYKINIHQTITML